MIAKPITTRSSRLKADWHLRPTLTMSRSDLWRHMKALEKENARLQDLLSERKEGIDLMRAIAARFDSLEAELFQLLRNFKVARSKFYQLTSTESLVHEMVAANRGMPYKQIASRLGMTTRAVKFHMGSIFSKTGSESRNEL